MDVAMMVGVILGALISGLVCYKIGKFIRLVIRFLERNSRD